MASSVSFVTATVLLLTATQAHAREQLGVENSVDHIATLVRPENYDAVQANLTALGFHTTPNLTSPAGVRNSVIWFEDLTYLELVTYTEENQFTAPIVAFLDVFEGAKLYGMSVSSAAQAATFLQGRGFLTAGPQPGPPLTLEADGTLATPQLWNDLLVLQPQAPDGSMFILEYVDGALQQMFLENPELVPMEHANTAARLDAMWLVTADLNAATAYYLSLGFYIRWQNRCLHDLGVKTTAVRKGNNEIVLMMPQHPGPVATFAAERVEGIIGARIEVHDLDVAHAVVEQAVGSPIQRFISHQGAESFRIPATSTGGLMLELFEPPSP